MKYYFIILIITLFSIQSCSKPKATVFKDETFSEEEMVKFCLVGDLGRETEHQQVIADALDREDCNRIIFLGDLVYPKGISSINDPELEIKFLAFYKPLIDRNPNLKINLVLGNHDHKKDPSAWIDLAKSNERFFFPNYYYMIDYGGLCIVALDTSFYYYAAKVAEAGEQALWLAQLNPRLKDCDVKVAVTHHPLKGGGYSGSADWEGSDGPLKAFLETYIIGKFDMHISGHVHILADDGIDEGTHLLISGTGGEVLGDGKAGFIILRWEPMNPKKIGYSFRQVDITANVFDETDGDGLPQAQKEEVVDGPEAVDKTRVEKNWFIRILNRVKTFFSSL